MLDTARRKIQPNIELLLGVGDRGLRQRFYFFLQSIFHAEFISTAIQIRLSDASTEGFVAVVDERGRESRGQIFDF